MEENWGHQPLLDLYTGDSRYPSVEPGSNPGAANSQPANLGSRRLPPFHLFQVLGGAGSNYD